ncbi:MAG: hypothetical protein ACFFD3_07895 [Candidatus Thorarchaeota archaeon]
MADEFKYEGEVYFLIGRDGEGFYEPSDFGMKAYSTCTACWRGYIMYYDCVDGELLLNAMKINVNDPKPINGVQPEPIEDLFKFGYQGLRLKTHFTGSIMLAKDFIPEMYVHMGFQRAIAFRKVIDLQIQDGSILVVKDFSEEMERRRRENPSKGARPNSPSGVDVSSWIEHRFSLKYDSEEE